MAAAPGYVIKNRRTLLERAEKFISSIYFTDVNLYGKSYKHTCPVSSLKHYAAPDRVSYEEAIKGDYQPTQIGASFGPTWSTHWFHVEGTIPESWVGEEVRLVWDSNSEAMLWIEGKPVQGLNHEHRKTEAILRTKASTKNLKYNFYVEMACNGLFGAGAGSQISPTDPNCTFALSKCHLAVVDHDVRRLMRDFEVLIGMVMHLPEDSNRGHQALFTLNDMVNTVEVNSRITLESAHELAQNFFQVHNGTSQHTIHAVGHCHIDSAWLWPYAESERKCGRSWSATIRLMELYPDMTFACSQAQQFEWVKIRYPKLYKEIKEYVAAGRFIPVGGTWVEMDGNVPSGEAFIRQFLYGQQFFQKEFGITCKEFWLPDTFGYSAQLPQICKLCGIERFLTQKMSWSLVNKFPVYFTGTEAIINCPSASEATLKNMSLVFVLSHHTFWWEGIDGSRVLAHFPPGDSYNMQGTPEDVLRSLNNFRDKGRSNQSLYLYGDGDGGQGPNAEMIERLQRMQDVDGLPKVRFSSPSEFFREVEDFESTNLCCWQGELYLELHNATYTTQAKTKQQNRYCEFLLRDAEIWSCLALTRSQEHKYPYDKLLALWKLLMLNQFHDVLPGTSIGEVYKDAMAYYKEVRKGAKAIINSSIQCVANSKECDANEPVALVFNTLSWRRREVVALTSTKQGESPKLKRKCSQDVFQVDTDGNNLAMIECPSFGFQCQTPVEVTSFVQIEKKSDEQIYLWNEHMEVVLDMLGRITACFKPGNSKNLIAAEEFGNQLVMFDDIPLYWDAWDVMDYHLQTRKPVTEAVQYAIIRDSGPLRATIEVSLKLSDKSYVKQLLTLDAGCPYLKVDNEVYWHESHKFLKVEFATSLLARQATYETQCGHLQRPTTFNTSWDWARFEVCGHKWADLSEYDLGLAVLNDCKYGWSCINNVLRLSLLRSSKAPDEKADMGVHKFSYAIMPHSGTFQSAGVIQAAYELNSPLRLKALDLPNDDIKPASFLKVNTPQVIVEALKKAEDSSSNIFILRAYEAYGGHVKATFKVNLGQQLRAVHSCNLLEELETEELNVRQEEDGSSSFQVTFTPFQICSVALCLK